MRAAGRWGMGLGLTRPRGTSFSPLSLFTGGAQGVWYDPSDISSMFQDSAGTTPAAVDSPVGKINDKSGNGNHAVQATAGARPLLKQDGSGKYYLLFDGVDDRIATPAIAITQPFDRISAIQQVSWVNGSIIYGDSETTFGGLLQQTPTTPLIKIYSGTYVAPPDNLPVGTTGIVTERFNGASSKVAINAGAYTTGAAGAAVPARLSIGAYVSGNSRSNVRMYGAVLISRALTDAEIASARSYLAGKAGVTL
jgi:hypothetical protein